MQLTDVLARHKWFLWICIVTVSIICLFTSIIVFTQCTPAESLWNPRLAYKQKCFLNFTTMAFVICCKFCPYLLIEICTDTCLAYAAFLDFLLAAFPWIALRRLNMKRKERIVICSSLSLGVLYAFYQTPLYTLLMLTRFLIEQVFAVSLGPLGWAPYTMSKITSVSQIFAQFMAIYVLTWVDATQIHSRVQRFGPQRNRPSHSSASACLSSDHYGSKFAKRINSAPIKHYILTESLALAPSTRGEFLLLVPVRIGFIGVPGRSFKILKSEI